MPVFRESRVVRHGTVKPESAEPAIRQVQVNFLAEPPLRANTEAIADDEHPNHQLRINRRPTNLTVKRRQLAPHPVELDKPVDRSQYMLRWHMTFERKLVKQSFLAALTFPHHRQHSSPPDWIESAPRPSDNSRLFQHNPPRADIRAQPLLDQLAD